LSGEQKESEPVMNEQTLDVLYDVYDKRYALEAQRKDTIENKASMLIGFSGFIAGLITGLIAGISTTELLFNIFFGGSIIFFTATGVVSLYVIRLKKYTYPSKPKSFKEIDELYKLKPIEIKDEIIKNTVFCITMNSVLNDKKAKQLMIAYYCATLGIVFILVAAIIYFF